MTEWLTHTLCILLGFAYMYFLLFTTSVRISMLTHESTVFFFTVQNFIIWLYNVIYSLSLRHLCFFWSFVISSVLQWTFPPIFLVCIWRSVSEVGVYPGVELLGLIVCEFSTFLNIAKLLYRVVATIYIIYQYMRFPIHTVSSTFYFHILLISLTWNGISLCFCLLDFFWLHCMACGILVP